MSTAPLYYNFISSPVRHRDITAVHGAFLW